MRITLILTLLAAFMLSCNDARQKKTPQSDTANPSQKTDQDSIVQRPQIYVQGIDVSHHQSDIQWEALKLSEIAFVFIKATGGIDYTDPKFSENWEGAQHKGLLRGAYHFYYAADDPAKQAAFFSETVLPVSDTTDLPPVLDLETHGMNSEIAVEQYQSDVKEWLAAIEKAFGRKPIIYTSKNFANAYLKNDFFSPYPLWLAEYEVDEPTLPETWQKAGWTFWQQSYTDTVPGIKGTVDHNIFAGSIKELQYLGHGN